MANTIEEQKIKELEDVEQIKPIIATAQENVTLPQEPITQEIQPITSNATSAGIDKQLSTAMTQTQEAATEAIQPISQPTVQKPVQMAATAEAVTPKPAEVKAVAPTEEVFNIQNGQIKPTDYVLPEEEEARKVTLQLFEQGKANIADFMAGKSPLDQMILDRALSKTHAENQTKMDFFQQQLAQQGKTGEGEGNALMAMLARDQNVAMADMLGSLSIDARNRLEQWNKYGVELGNTLLEQQRSNDFNTLDFLMKSGASPQEMNAQSQKISDRYGVTMPDFTNPDNMVTYSNAKQKYNDWQSSLTQYLQANDFEGYKAAYEAKIKEGDFSGFSFMVDKAPDITDFQRKYKLEVEADNLNMTQAKVDFLQGLGQNDLAADYFLNQFGEGGMFSGLGTGMDTDKLRNDFLSSSPEQKELFNSYSNMFETAKTNGTGINDLTKIAQYIADRADGTALGDKMKAYIDNPQLMSMPREQIEKIEENLRGRASTIIGKGEVPIEQDYIDHSRDLKKIYATSELSTMAKKSFGVMDEAERAKYGVTENLDSYTDNELSDLYAKFDLDNKMVGTKDLDKKTITESVKSMYKDYFNTPQEIDEFERSIGDLVAGGYKIGADNKVDMAGQMYPWDDEKRKYVYMDWDGTQYDNDYNINDASEDTLILNKLWEDHIQTNPTDHLNRADFYQLAKDNGAYGSQQRESTGQTFVTDSGITINAGSRVEGFDEDAFKTALYSKENKDNPIDYSSITTVNSTRIKKSLNSKESFASLSRTELKDILSSESSIEYAKTLKDNGIIKEFDSFKGSTIFTIDSFEKNAYPKYVYRNEFLYIVEAKVVKGKQRGVTYILRNPTIDNYEASIVEEFDTHLQKFI